MEGELISWKIRQLGKSKGYLTYTLMYSNSLISANCVQTDSVRDPKL